MLKEEAIEKLKSQRNVICNGCLHAVGWCESHCKFSEAIDMAIEALKQPEIVRCKDCQYFKMDCQEPYCRIEHDYTSTNGYCHHGKRAEMRTDD